MAASEEAQLEPPPAVPAMHRAKVRLGFGLCCAGLAVALVAELGTLIAPLFVAPSGMEWLQKDQPQMTLAHTVLGVIVEIALVVGWFSLYLVPHAQRWRQTCTWLLLLAGCDFVMLSAQLLSSDKSLVASAELIGSALGWVEMWMIAVLAAEAAESAERPDITNQTEVTGRLIIWGGFLWLAAQIWLFDPNQWPAAEPEPNSFGSLLGIAAVVMSLFVWIRGVLFCAGLAVAYSSTGDPSQPEAPA